MNKVLLISIPLSLIVIASIVGGIFFYEKHHSHKENHTTIHDWFKCKDSFAYTECDFIQDETQKIGCNKAAKLVSDLTYNGSETILDACAKFSEYYRVAQANDELNANNYFYNCYINSQVRKNAATNSNYNDKIFTPFYVKCAGF